MTGRFFRRFGAIHWMTGRFFRRFVAVHWMTGRFFAVLGLANYLLIYSCPVLEYIPLVAQK